MSSLGPLEGKTPNYKFNLINFNWFSWHDYEHDNWALADSLFFTLLGVQNVKGVWQPNTEMFIGERWVDSADGSMWECQVDHTSGSGTFAEDRAANPSYWIGVGQGGDVVGPATAVSGNFASFDGTTGKLIADSGDSATSFDAAGSASTVQGNLDTHIADGTNPHGVTAAQAGAEPDGSVAAHDAAIGSHGTTAFTHDLLTAVDEAAAQGKLDVPGLNADNAFTGAATIGTPTGGMLAAGIWNFALAPRINNIPITAGAIVQLGTYSASAGEIRAEGVFSPDVDFVVGVLTGFRMATAADDFGWQLLNGTTALGGGGYYGTSASHNGTAWTLSPVNASSVAQVTFGYNTQTGNSASGFFFIPSPYNDVSADNTNRVSIISLFSAVGATALTPSYTTIAGARYTGTWASANIDGIRIRAMTDSVGAGVLQLVGFKAS